MPLNKETKPEVFKYFGNIRHNSVASNAFPEVVKVMNHTGLWNANPASYFPDLPR